MDKKQFDAMLAKYADVIVKVGLNIQQGHELFIRGILEDAPFARKVAESAYRTGAYNVDVQFTDEAISRMRMEHAPEKSLEDVAEWQFKRYEHHRKNGHAELAIASSNPDLFSGINPERIAKARKTLMEKIAEPLRPYENLANWCVVATATPDWAVKVFPGIPEAEAVEKLWDAIFKACRIDQADPVSAWESHTEKLLKYKKYLDAKRYAALHYKAPGTDLTIGLPKNHIWNSAQETFQNGVTCTVNIPTEEVFTAAHKDKASGYVTATKPLNLQGVLIEDFTVTFENGRAVKITAKKGEADLKKLIETDENASRLGEAALVPHSSPISQSGILFYNTLFDENASCHLAFGNAYRTSIIGGEEMTEEEFAANSGNKSMVHTDFMIGSGEMDIDGIREDGASEPVMRKGEWAFTV